MLCGIAIFNFNVNHWLVWHQVGVRVVGHSLTISSLPALYLHVSLYILKVVESSFKRVFEGEEVEVGKSLPQMVFRCGHDGMRGIYWS